MNQPAVEFDEGPSQEELDAGTPTETPAENPETPPEGAESEAPPAAEGVQPEPKVEFSDEQQAFINEKIVGKRVAKQKEAERQAEEERKKREEAEAELAKLKQPERPVVPDMPNPYDDDFESKLQAREEAIVAQAKYDGQQALAQQQEQQRQYQAQQEAAAEQQRRVVAYSGRAEKLGIEPQELQQAGHTVAQMGVADDVVNHILSDEQGPSITVYLAKNPMAIEEMHGMSPMQAAIYIENQVKPKAVGSRPSPTPSPNTVETPQGSGMPEGERGPKGATFE